MPRQDRAQETAEAILTATAHILTETGYDTASINRIVERAVIGIGSPHQSLMTMKLGTSKLLVVGALKIT